MSISDIERQSDPVHCKYRSGEVILNELLEMFRHRALGKYMDSNNDPLPESSEIQQPLLPGWATCPSSLEQNSMNSVKRPAKSTNWQR